jgi:hypothetical protein
MTANTHHTKLKGDIAVAAVILDLTKKGCIISEPMSENAPYDLICDTGEKLLRIQVKYRVSGYIPYRTSWTDKSGTHTNEIDITKIDYFALVNEDYSIICYPLSVMAGNTIAFSIPNSSTPYNWYEDYIDFKNEIQAKHINRNTTYIRKDVVINATKIVWPSIEEMTRLVFEKPSSQLAKDLGVSDSAIYKFCKKNNIPKPERGYWTK